MLATADGCSGAAAWITPAIDHFWAWLMIAARSPGKFCPRLKPRSWIFTADFLASLRSASVAAAIR